MAQVLLINPPRQKNGNSSLFNNALLWIASYLENNGVSTEVIFLAKNFDQTLFTEIEKHNPKYIGISLKWWDTIYGAEYLAKLIKTNYPEIFLFCGGQTATYYSQKILENTCFDAVIEGDGELPVLNLIKGTNFCNCKIIDDEKNIISYEKSYIQDNTKISSLTLSPQTAQKFNYWKNASNYIWTGKGCAMTCFYCGGGRDGQKNTFGRTGYIYRSIDSVINDIEIITQYKKTNTFMLDYDPLAKGKEVFYKALFNSLPKKKYNCEFYFWTLPSEDFIDLISETFDKLVFGIDLQVFSEPLRKKLSKLNFIKPLFFTNDYLLEFLDFCQAKKNIKISISGLLGVPFETKQDIQEIYSFSDRLYTRYENIFDVSFSPITLEPASALLNNPSKYNYQALRSSFQDFRNYSKAVFETNFLDDFFSNYDQYLKYTGLKNLNTDYDEFIYDECFNVQEKITAKFNNRINKGFINI